MENSEFLEGYLKYLSKNLIETKEDNFYEFELPFPRPAGDSVILLIKAKRNGEYIISDDGFMDAYLFSYGIDLWKDRTEKIKDHFTLLKERYNFILDEAPYIAIKANKNNIFSRLYDMSNIISELGSLKLLAPSVQFEYFKTSVNLYFKKHHLNFKTSPDRIRFEMNRQEYSFELDFLIYDKSAYIKLISTTKMIHYWALNFIKMKEYYKDHDSKVELWTIFNDKAGLDSENIFKWFGDSVDHVIGWYSDKEKLEKLI